jgi:hypothetical protein
VLEVAVAGLVGWVALGQIAPGGAVEHGPRISSGSAPPIRPQRWCWDQGFQDLPLLVCKVHTLSPCLERRLADHYMPLRRFMRSLLVNRRLRRPQGQIKELWA